MTGKIKLVHSGGNSVSVAVPTNAPSASEVEFKLPQSDGSSGQALVTDASGNLSFASVGKFASYAVIADQKDTSSNGGAFTNGADRTRDLNTEILDADNIVSISNNQFTLQAGSYYVTGSAPAYAVTRHTAWLYDVTNSQNASAYGTSCYGGVTVNRSFFYGRFTISGATVFEVRHKCTTTRNTNGFGVNNTLYTNTFTVVEIFKEA